MPIKRPIITKEIIEKSAKETAKEILTYANFGHIEEESLAKDLADEYSPGDNGYDLAKKLDRRGYDPDALFVECLDVMDIVVKDHYRKFCWEWVKKENIKPPFPLGVKIKQEYSGLNVVQGVIVGISEHTPACYEVDYGKPNDKWLIKFENAVLVEEAKASSYRPRG